MLAGNLNLQSFMQCDVTEFCYGKVSKGKAAEEEIKEAVHQACPTMGACPSMGTANTMQILAESLGMTFPHSDVYKRQETGLRGNQS